MPNPIVTALMQVDRVQTRLELHGLQGIPLQADKCKELAADMRTARETLSDAITRAQQALGAVMK